MTRTVRRNENGGIDFPGEAHTIEKKTEIALVYKRMVDEGLPVTARLLAKASGCGKTFANQIITEIQSTGSVVNPFDAHDRAILRGAGAKTLSIEPEDGSLLGSRRGTTNARAKRQRRAQSYDADDDTAESQKPAELINGCQNICPPRRNFDPGSEVQALES